ncbi:mandelate racemase/muconate lactonizing enzyme family protein [Amycolatopsis sp. NPDC051903]|uniref:mandelate racemase/muconate lactonizing enzyme family protein n=1 Tax=Amycolatopsis sp. NPDC051903 TaxID=3363936 RepID=UPI00379923DF
MKITDITATAVRADYRPEYMKDKRFYVKDEIQVNVVVQVHTDEGVVGVGEAAHCPGLYGETAPSTLGGIDLLKQGLAGLDPLQLTKANAIMDRYSPAGNVAAKAGIDIALHDLAGKILGAPVYQLLGGRVHDGVPTHITPATYEDTATDLARLMEQGYRFFKQKMSGDTDYDLAIVRSLLPVIGDRATLSLDANQAWSVNQALLIADVLEREVSLEQKVILEQPVLANDFRGLAKIRQATRFPVMADDGIRTVADLNRVIETDAADIVSLKISRVGGVQKCQQMIRVAEAHNIDYIVDEINEMKIANTAVAHLAVASRNPLYTGVACHTLFEQDIVANGGVTITDGIADVSDRPGLGIGSESVLGVDVASTAVRYEYA